MQTDLILSTVHQRYSRNHSCIAVEGATCILTFDAVVIAISSAGDLVHTEHKLPYNVPVVLTQKTCSLKRVTWEGDDWVGSFQNTDLWIEFPEFVEIACTITVNSKGCPIVCCQGNLNSPFLQVGQRKHAFKHNK